MIKITPNININAIKPSSLASYRIYNEYSDCFMKSGLDQIKECMEFLDVANSPQQFAKTVLKMTHGNPEQSSILWGLYRAIGKKDNSSGGWSKLNAGNMKHAGAQLEIFKHAFLKSPDFGEFNAFATCSGCYDKDNKILSSLFERGLLELKNQPQKHLAETKYEFLKANADMRLDNHDEIWASTIKTTLNTFNDKLKLDVKRFKEFDDIADLDSGIEQVIALTDSIPSPYSEKISTPFMSKFEKTIDQYIEAHRVYYRSAHKTYKELGESIPESSVEKEVKATKLSCLENIIDAIDKNFTDDTIEKLYEKVEAQNASRF